MAHNYCQPRPKSEQQLSCIASWPEIVTWPHPNCKGPGRQKGAHRISASSGYFGPRCHYKANVVPLTLSITHLAAVESLFATPACAVESTSGDLHSSSALPQAEKGTQRIVFPGAIHLLLLSEKQGNCFLFPSRTGSCSQPSGLYC